MKSRALLLTPAGSGAIAVVRLTGPKTAAFLAAHFSRDVRPGRCVHGTLIDGSNVIDDPVVVMLPDGVSVDVNVHGGPWVVRSVIELARAEGFEVCERLELPLPDDAVEGTTEIGVEIAAHLPLATTELALSELLRQGEAWEQWAAMEDRERRAEAEKMLADRGLWWLLHPPTIAIVGAANVGKSTLANQLFGQERSITADLPGTTRDWVGEMANVDGLAVKLVDTPGIRVTNDPIEAEAIARAGDEVRQADLVVLVLDASRAWEPEQAALRARFAGALVVVNKCDLPAAWDWRAMDACEVVATLGEGIDALRRGIKCVFGAENRNCGARCWTERQRILLRSV